MPLIDLTTTDFGSLTENVNRLKLSNMYVIKNPLSLSGKSYISRPSVSTLSQISGQRIRGIFNNESNGETTLFVVADSSFYTVSPTGSYEKIGDIPGQAFCSFASSIYHVAIVSDGGVFLYDGMTLTQVAVPDFQKASGITSLDNYFIISIENTNKFYWIRPAETIIDPLNFSSAERSPSDIVALTALGDELWTIGKTTTEIFIDSGDTNAPFIRIAGRVYQLGCADKNSLVKCNKNSIPCLVWVTSTKEVVLTQGVPSKISNTSVEELLKRSSNFMAWTFRTNRHDFYILTTDNETIVYDIHADDWYRWSSYQKDTWDASSGVQVDDKIYAINPAQGLIYSLTSSPVDNTTDYIVCEVGGFIPNTTNVALPCNTITLFTNYGFSSSYSNGPLIEVRFSDNAGSTWSPYYQAAAGTKGRYNTTIRFRSLGSFRRPGRFVEFRFSEINTFRLDGATLNDSA